jgi:hypothetical protein
MIIFGVDLLVMDLKQSFEERAVLGKGILSKQLPFSLDELKAQILRLKNDGNQGQKKKKKSHNALLT